MPLCSVPGCNFSGVHLFPLNAELKKQWETVIRRKDWVATDYARICRNHFKDSDYVGVSAYTGYLPKNRCLKKGTIPSIFPWTKSNSSPSTSSRAQRYQRRTRRQLDYTLNREKNTSYLNDPYIVDEEIVLSGTSPVREGLEESVPSIFPRTKSNSPSSSNRAQRYQRRPRRQLDYTLNREKNTSYLNVPDIVDEEIVLSSTSPVREGLEESVKSVPSIFPRTKSTSPSTSNRAQRYQRRTRRQLDYTLNSEKNTSYLNVPDIVDEEIVLSGPLPVREALEESVKTTATQTNGFNVQDIFAPKNIKIIIPSFLKGKSQLLELQLMKDRKLASKRVHIERIIGLTKTFKILKSELSPYYSPLGSKIMFVCAMLCNFREKIIS